MNYKLLFICSFFVVSCSNKKEVNQYMHPNTITTSTHDFIPSEFNCSLGDTVYFILGPSHDMIQVNEINFNKNTPYPLKGGFNCLIKFCSRSSASLSVSVRNISKNFILCPCNSDLNS